MMGDGELRGGREQQVAEDQDSRRQEDYRDQSLGIISLGGGQVLGTREAYEAPNGT